MTREKPPVTGEVEKKGKAPRFVTLGGKKGRKESVSWFICLGQRGTILDI